MPRFWAALRMVWRVMDESNLDLIAAGVAFYAMLAIFPAFAALIALWGFFSDPAMIEDQLIVLSNFIPPDALDLFEGQISGLIKANNNTLGQATLISLLLALWSARAGVMALMRGLNVVHAAPPRSGIRQMLTAILMTLILIATALITLSAIVVVPLVLVLLPQWASPDMGFNIMRWVLVVLVVVFGIGLVYRYGPNKGPTRLPWITPGAICAVLIWAIISAGFSYYLSNFGNYNQIYGSIGAVIALLMWFFISAWVVLAGAALNQALAQLK